MTDFTNKNIEFLSNRELINILRSVLEEIDAVASVGAHRSTTYLAVSTIEGLCGELLHLLGKPVPDRSQAKLSALRSEGALPKDFESLYDAPLRTYRNFMHPSRELTEVVIEKRLTPIAQSVAQLALGGLNALIEEYADRRFFAGYQWQVEHGLAQVPSAHALQMPQKPGDNPYLSLVVGELTAKQIQRISFEVDVPPDAIFDFVYSYFSKNQFMIARIEGRLGPNDIGLDNGVFQCATWGVLSSSGRYKLDSEPDPNKRSHAIEVSFSTHGSMTLTVDGVQLALGKGADWNFVPKGKIGFMSEWGMISIVDLELQTR